MGYNILQNGVMKSGNYWLYKIIQTILEKGSIEKRSFIKNSKILSVLKEELDFDKDTKEFLDIDVMDIKENQCKYSLRSFFSYPIEDLEKYVDSCTHVWTHSQFNSNTVNVYSLFDKKVYIIRDPRDAALSMANFDFSTYRKFHKPSNYSSTGEWLDHQFSNFIINWENHVLKFLQNSIDLDIHIIFYEQLLNYFEKEVHDLTNYLGMDFDYLKIDLIKSETNTSSMREKTPDHVREAKHYKWVDNLSDKNIEYCKKNIDYLLNALNYPLDKSNIRLDQLPFVDKFKIQNIQKKKNSFYEKIRKAAYLFKKEILT